MTDAYARAGVDVGAADVAIGALVGVLRTIETGRASRVVPLPGHYAAVLEVAPNLGIAVGTDGVGSKLIVAEQTGRYDTVGVDCIAMNVNDVICVGAEPIAVLDYLAVEQTDPDVFAAIARGLKTGAEQAGVEIPGGEVAVLPELIRGHPSPTGFDLTAACFGTVALDAIVTGAACAPGDALIGLPSSGLHSNGYTLARRVLEPLGLDTRPAALGGASVADALLEPTVIYVRAVLDLLRSDVPVHGLAHITGGGLANLLRLSGTVGWAIESPLPVPAVFDLIRDEGGGAGGRALGRVQHGLRLRGRGAGVGGRRGGRATGVAPPGGGEDRHGHRRMPGSCALPCAELVGGGLGSIGGARSAAADERRLRAWSGLRPVRQPSPETNGRDGCLRGGQSTDRAGRPGGTSPGADVNVGRRPDQAELPTLTCHARVNVGTHRRTPSLPTFTADAAAGTVDCPPGNIHPGRSFPGGAV